MSVANHPSPPPSCCSRLFQAFKQMTGAVIFLMRTVSRLHLNDILYDVGANRNQAQRIHRSSGHTFIFQILLCTRILSTINFTLHEEFHFIKILGSFQSFCLSVFPSLYLYPWLALLLLFPLYTFLALMSLPLYLSTVIPGSPLSSIGQAGNKARLAEPGILHGPPGWA